MSFAGLNCNILTTENVTEYLSKGSHWPFMFRNFTEIEPNALEMVDSDELNFSYNKLKYLPANLFSHNVKFNRLYFVNNLISGIHPLALQKLENLTDLNLANNKLVSLEDDVLQMSSKLQRLWLNGNQIATIGPNAFLHSTALRELYIGNNRLTEFNLNLLSSTKVLEKLYLKNNELRGFDYHNLKKSVPDLKEIALTGNYFECSFADNMLAYLKRKRIQLHDYTFEIAYNITCISDELDFDKIPDNEWKDVSVSLMNSLYNTYVINLYLTTYTVYAIINRSLVITNYSRSLEMERN